MIQVPSRTLHQRAASTADFVGGWLAAAARSSGTRPRHRIVVNSLPKAGTNLLGKALVAMAGTRAMRVALVRDTAPPGRNRRPQVPVGIDWPIGADAAAVRRMIARTPPGGVLLAHLPYSTTLASILRELDVRMTVILRDPRDVAVSLAAYIVDRPHHFLHDRFVAMAPPDRVTAGLEGLPPDERGIGLRDLVTRFRDAQAWAAEPFCLSVRFEDLVGASGGGDRSQQVTTLGQIADHVGIELDRHALEAQAGTLFGGTDTFRRGRIGGWQEAFTPEQREIASRILGDLLRELGYPPTDAP